MSTQNFFVAPSASYNVTCRSGNVYQAVNSIISSVAPGDVTDVINAGCRQAAGPDAGANLAAVSGRFYVPSAGVTPGTLLTVASTIYAFPFRTSGNLPIQTISANVTTGQTGGQVRFGIYTDLAGAPSALVAGSDSGNQVATGTAAATFTPTSPIQLNDGWYWAALAASASSTMPTVSSITTSYGDDLSYQLGFDTLAHAVAASGEAVSGVSAAFTYAALPAAFPTASYAEIFNAGCPLIVLGY